MTFAVLVGTAKVMLNNFLYLLGYKFIITLMNNHGPAGSSFAISLSPGGPPWRRGLEDCFEYFDGNWDFIARMSVDRNPTL